MVFRIGVQPNPKVTRPVYPALMRLSLTVNLRSSALKKFLKTRPTRPFSGHDCVRALYDEAFCYNNGVWIASWGADE